MRNDYAQRGGPLHLAGIGEEEVLDPVPSVAARNLPLHPLVRVQRLLDRPVAEAVNRRLQPVRGGVEHELINLVLVVVRLADVLERPVRVALAQRIRWVDRVHEQLDDPAAQPVRDIVLQKRAVRGRLRRGEEAVAPAHLVDHDGKLVALVRVAVHLGALGHHDGVADAGHTVRQVAQRVLLDQVRHNLRPERVDVRTYRRVMHQVRRPLIEHPRRFAALVAQDLTAARIRRLEVDPRDRHCLGVRVAGVIGKVHHADRIVACHVVQLRPRQPAAVRMPRPIPQSPDPLPCGSRIRRRRERIQDRRLARQRRHSAINRARLECRHREVIVRIAEAGDQRPAAQVDVRGVGRHRAPHLVALTDRNNLAVPHRDPRRDPIQPIHRQHASAGE